MKTVISIGIVTLSMGLSSCLFDVTYTIGGTTTGLRGSGLVLQNSSGKYLSVIANGSFTFASGVANDGTYSVTVRTQPSNPDQTCSVVNATGTIHKAAISNVIVHCSQAGRYAYVANQSANSISAFAIETTGALTALSGSPLASNGTTPVALVVDPNGAFVYIVNSGSNEITAYAIDDATGVLGAADVEIATGNGPAAAAIDPTDRYLYVANETDGTVSAFSIDSSTGVATPVSGSPYAAGTQPSSLQTDSTGSYLYVTNFGDGTVTAYAIDFTTGQLTLISGSPFGAGAGAGPIAISPSGTFAYVANSTAASISGFSTSSGILAAVSGSPLSVGSSPESLAVSPSGEFLFAANATSQNDIATYTITPSSGSLTLGSTVSAGTLPVSVAVDPSGLFVYAANEDSADVSVYSVDTTSGALTAVTGSPFAAGAGPRSIVID